MPSVGRTRVGPDKGRNEVVGTRAKREYVTSGQKEQAMRSAAGEAPRVLTAYLVKQLLFPAVWRYELAIKSPHGCWIHLNMSGSVTGAPTAGHIGLATLPDIGLPHLATHAQEH